MVSDSAPVIACFCRCTVALLRSLTPARERHLRVVEGLVLDAIGAVAPLVVGVCRDVGNDAAQTNRLCWRSRNARVVE